jgi:hypothetical protein
VHGIYFMLFGCLISSWKESKVMENGHSFVLVSLQVWQIVGVKSLRNCTLDMKERYVQFFPGFILVLLNVFCGLLLVIF